ncbi:MAG: histidine phosphatase family protein [Caulobacteraceae bacterium]
MALRESPDVAPTESPIAPQSSSATGMIVLARHGEPALSRKISLDSAGYRRWWDVYEEGGILEGQTPPQDLLEAARQADVIFVSTRRRAQETAAAVVDGRPVVSDAMFIEAPLPPPPLPGFIKFGPKIWGVISRTAWWFFGYHEGKETRRQAQTRVSLAARRLVDHADRGENVLLVAHGFFNQMMALELRGLGWRCVANNGFKYWATKRFERR